MEKSIVFFDGVCNLCTSSVQFILRYDTKDRFRFSSLQGKYAESLITDPALKSADSIILYKNNTFYTRSSAVLRIAAELRFPVNLLAVFIVVPGFIRNAVYNLIAAKRYKWFGKKEVCWLPDEKLNSKFIE